MTRKLLPNSLLPGEKMVVLETLFHILCFLEKENYWRFIGCDKQLLVMKLSVLWQKWRLVTHKGKVGHRIRTLHDTLNTASVWMSLTQFNHMTQFNSTLVISHGYQPCPCLCKPDPQLAAPIKLGIYCYSSISSLHSCHPHATIIDGTCWQKTDGFQDEISLGIKK